VLSVRYRWSSDLCDPAGAAGLYLCCVLGIAGAVIFVILLVLLVWMICVRATKRKATNEKAQLGPGAEVAHRWKN